MSSTCSASPAWDTSNVIPHGAPPSLIPENSRPSHPCRRLFPVWTWVPWGLTGTERQPVYSCLAAEARTGAERIHIPRSSADGSRGCPQIPAAATYLWSQRPDVAAEIYQVCGHGALAELPAWLQSPHPCKPGPCSPDMGGGCHCSRCLTVPSWPRDPVSQHFQCHYWRHMRRADIGSMNSCGSKTPIPFLTPNFGCRGLHSSPFLAPLRGFLPPPFPPSNKD